MDYHIKLVLHILRRIFQSKGLSEITERQILNTIIPNALYPFYMLNDWGNEPLDKTAYQIYHQLTQSQAHIPLVRPDILDEETSLKALVLDYGGDVDSWRIPKKPQTVSYSNAEIFNLIVQAFPAQASQQNNVLIHFSVSNYRILSERISVPFLYIDKNLTSLVEQYLLNANCLRVSTELRLRALEAYTDQNTPLIVKVMLLLIPSIFMEYIETLYTIEQKYLNKLQPKLSFDTSAWVGDPCFHFFMMKYSKRHVGIQHGGGYLLKQKISKTMETEFACYDDFLYWPPFTPTVEPFRFIQPPKAYSLKKVAIQIIKKIIVYFRHFFYKQKIVVVLTSSLDQSISGSTETDIENLLTRLEKLKLKNMAIKAHPIDTQKYIYPKKHPLLNFLGTERLEALFRKEFNTIFVIYSLGQTFMYYPIMQSKPFLIVINSYESLMHSYKNNESALMFVNKLRKNGLLLNINELSADIFNKQNLNLIKKQSLLITEEMNKPHLDLYIRNILEHDSNA